MFTGIVERLGRVLEAGSDRLTVQYDADDADPVRIGESVSANGCCLTVVSTEPLSFDLSEETLRKTALGHLKPGSAVNLERAVRADGRFGGHIVQGHVDATGRLAEVEQMEQSHRLRFEFPARFGKYVIEKGSITVDGISLTVVDLTADSFDVWIVPHTWEHTNLRELQVGDRVNLEFDLLAKYAEKLVGSTMP